LLDKTSSPSSSIALNINLDNFHSWKVQILDSTLRLHQINSSIRNDARHVIQRPTADDYLLLPDGTPSTRPAYPKDTNGELSTEGHRYLREDNSIFTKDNKQFLKENSEMLEIMLSPQYMSPASRTILNTQSSFLTILNSSDAFGLFKLCESTHNKGSSSQILKRTREFVNIKQTGSHEELIETLCEAEKTFISDFESPLYPGYVKIDHIVGFIYLGAVDYSKFSFKLDQVYEKYPNGKIDNPHEVMNHFQAYSIQTTTYSSSDSPSDVVSALSSVSVSTPRPKSSTKPCPYCVANNRSENLHTEETCPLKSTRRKEAQASQRSFPEKPCELCLAEGKVSYHFQRNHHRNSDRSQPHRDSAQQQQPRSQPQSGNQHRIVPSTKAISDARALLASIEDDTYSSPHDPNDSSASYAHELAVDGYFSYPAIGNPPPQLSIPGSQPLYSDISAAAALRGKEANFDNCCTHSIVHDISLLRDVIPTDPVTIGGIKGAVKATHKGQLKFLPEPYSTCLYSRDINVNLVSLGHIERCGGSYSAKDLVLTVLAKDGSTLAKSYMSSRNIYPVQPESLACPGVTATDESHDSNTEIATPQPHYSPEVISRINEAQDLHEFFGHPSDAVLSAGLDNGCIPNCHLTSNDVRNNRKLRGLCPQCLEGKMKQHPHNPPSTSPPSERPGEELWLDIQQLPAPSPALSTHAITAVCANTGFMTFDGHNSKSKAKVLDALNCVVAQYNGDGHKVSRMVTDSENVLQACGPSLAATQISLTHTPPGEHAKRIERYIQTANGRQRSLLAGLPFKIPIKYDAFSKRHAIFGMNSLPNTLSSPSSPFELKSHIRLPFDSKFPRIKFGATAMVTQFPDKRAAIAKRDGTYAKAVPVAELGVCMGLDNNRKPSCYIFALENGQVVPRKVVSLVNVHPFGWQPQRVNTAVLRIPSQVSVQPLVKSPFLNSLIQLSEPQPRVPLTPLPLLSSADSPTPPQVEPVNTLQPSTGTQLSHTNNILACTPPTTPIRLTNPAATVMTLQPLPASTSTPMPMSSIPVTSPVPVPNPTARVPVSTLPTPAVHPVRRSGRDRKPNVPGSSTSRASISDEAMPQTKADALAILARIGEFPPSKLTPTPALSVPTVTWASVVSRHTARDNRKQSV